MSFRDTLRRLREASSPEYRLDAMVLVPVKDLRVLLFHFDRLDRAARIEHAKAHPEEIPR